MKKKELLIIAILIMAVALFTGCGGSDSSDDAAGDQQETAAADNGAEDDFLVGTWFAKECSKDGETADPEDIFGGTFYLYFEEDGDCTMAIDQKRAPVKWERTDDGVTLTGDDTYQITFPDDSGTKLVITINGIDTLMEKYEEESE